VRRCCESKFPSGKYPLIAILERLSGVVKWLELRKGALHKAEWGPGITGYGNMITDLKCKRKCEESLYQRELEIFVKRGLHLVLLFQLLGRWVQRRGMRIDVDL